MKNGVKIGNRKTWKLTSIKDFFGKLQVAAGFYREIVEPSSGYHLGSRFKLLNSTSFKQWPPLMLACMITSNKKCSNATNKKTMNKYSSSNYRDFVHKGYCLT